MPEEINIIQIQKLVDEFLIIMCNPKNSRCSLVDFLEEKFPDMPYKERANLKIKINTIIEDEELGIWLYNNEYKLSAKGYKIIQQGGYIKYLNKKMQIDSAPIKSNRLMMFSVIIALLTLIATSIIYLL